MAYLGYATQTLLDSFDGHMTGMIPADFLSLVEASIWFIPKAADADFDAQFVIMAATSGEPYNVKQTNSPIIQWVLVKDQIFSYNLTALVPVAIAANDVLGVGFSSLGPGNQPVELVGLRLRYKIRFPEMSGLAVEREAFWTCEKSELPH